LTGVQTCALPISMAEIKKTMREGVDYEIVYDPTQFVRASIDAVVHTLLEAVLLVVLVVILFLQTWRASMIPLLAVAVSIIGTFAVAAAAAPVAGVDHRHVRRAVPLRLLDQRADAVRAGARHRHRRRRRDRRRRERRAQYRSRSFAARRHLPGDARSLGPHHRDRAGA